LTGYYKPEFKGVEISILEWSKNMKTGKIV
jgi:hypothetical protein